MHLLPQCLWQIDGATQKWRTECQRWSSLLLQEYLLPGQSQRCLQLGGKMQLFGDPIWCDTTEGVSGNSQDSPGMSLRNVQPGGESRRDKKYSHRSYDPYPRFLWKTGEPAISHWRIPLRQTEAHIYEILVQIKWSSWTLTNYKVDKIIISSFSCKCIFPSSLKVTSFSSGLGPNGSLKDALFLWLWGALPQIEQWLKIIFFLKVLFQLDSIFFEEPSYIFWSWPLSNSFFRSTYWLI